MLQPTVVIIAGPTGVGKTAAAIRLARHYHTAIISADSRQCFKELSIGVARPSLAELSAVPHYFIASHSVLDDVNATVFEHYALEKANELFKTHPVIIMAGGTGLYIRAFCEGLDRIPAIRPGIRDRILERYAAGGLSWLQAEVALKDPVFFRTGEIQNPQRLMRALEVIESTGQSIVSFRTGHKVERNFVCLRIGLHLPKEELNRRIGIRVDQMIASGLVDEVRSLQVYRHRNALQTVGYAEIFELLDGKLSIEEAAEQIRQHTRQYAKRQMTWFRKDPGMTWFGPDEIDGMIAHIEASRSGRLPASH